MDSDVVNSAAKLLADNHIITTFGPRSEIGPRVRSRSILANPLIYLTGVGQFD